MMYYSDEDDEPYAKNKRPRDSLLAPWARGAKTLAEEVLEFAAFVDPGEEELAARQEAVDRIQQVATVLFRSCTPVAMPYGSLMTGLMLPDSDIDVTIDGVTTQSHHHQAIPARLALSQLAQLLTSSGVARSVQLISGARVPLVKAVDAATGFHVDISFSTDLASCHFIAEQMYLNPVARPVCLVLKQLLRERDLNETYSGGLGSYALSLMVLHVVARCSACHEGIRYDVRSSGAVLTAFLELFSGDGPFDYDTDVVPPLSWAGVYAKKRDMGFSSHEPGGICISDPLRPGVDVGRPTTRVADIRFAFREARDALRAAGGGTVLGCILHFPQDALDARAKIVETMRRRRKQQQQAMVSQECSYPAGSQSGAGAGGVAAGYNGVPPKCYSPPRRPSKKFRI